MATILITDDTPSEAALMAGVIKQLGHHVITAVDGETCIAAARASRPSLILLDVVMPKMDGFNTCRRLKKDPDTAGIPIVIVSTKNQDSDKFWAERQGANHYITKPFTPEQLSEAVRAFLN
jgi:twitching motility two-component system response regulator PilH